MLNAGSMLLKIGPTAKSDKYNFFKHNDPLLMIKGYAKCIEKPRNYAEE
jgi:hypothetical protein